MQHADEIAQCMRDMATAKFSVVLSARRGCVVIVEDDPECRSVLRMVVQRASPDAEIMEAGSVTDALRKIEGAEKIRYVISDIGLPDGTGNDVLEYIRRRDSHIPVIVFTGQDGYQRPWDDPDCLTISKRDPGRLFAILETPEESRRAMVG